MANGNPAESIQKVYDKLGRGNIVNCEKCSFQTEFRAIKALHESLHVSKPEQKRGLECPHCPYSSNNVKHFRIHYGGHSDKGKSTQRTYLCEFCELPFTDLSCHDKHVERDHQSMPGDVYGRKIEPNQLPCTVCTDFFFTENELLFHMHTTHGLDTLREYLREMHGILHITPPLECDGNDASFPGYIIIERRVDQGAYVSMAVNPAYERNTAEPNDAVVVSDNQSSFAADHQGNNPSSASFSGLDGSHPTTLEHAQPLNEKPTQYHKQGTAQYQKEEMRAPVLDGPGQATKHPQRRRQWPIPVHNYTICEDLKNKVDQGLEKLAEIEGKVLTPERQCTICEYSSNNKHALRKHLVAHKEFLPNGFMCNILTCHFTVKTKKSIRSHSINHHSEGTSKLPLLEDQADHDQNRGTHVLYNHGPRGKIVPKSDCSYCKHGPEFTSKRKRRSTDEGSTSGSGAKSRPEGKTVSPVGGRRQIQKKCKRKQTADKKRKSRMFDYIFNASL